MTVWTWAAASRRGSAHAERGDRRQDAFRIAAPAAGHDILTIVACDGAGSASHGGEGASLAAWTLLECARSWVAPNACLPSPDTVTAWMQVARFKIAASATLRALAPTDFATTVVIAMSDGSATLTAQIGDGAVVGREAATGAWTALSWPEHGDYIATTYFLTDPGTLRLRIATHHDRAIDRLVVMTDGLERLALDFTCGEPHAAFFDKMFRPLVAAEATGPAPALSQALGRYLDSAPILERTDDDRTLILAARG